MKLPKMRGYRYGPQNAKIIGLQNGLLKGGGGSDGASLGEPPEGAAGAAPSEIREYGLLLGGAPSRSSLIDGLQMWGTKLLGPGRISRRCQISKDFGVTRFMAEKD